MFIFHFFVLFSQENDSISKQHTNSVANFYELEQINGVDSIDHTDDIGAYKITIPLWWRIRQTPDPSFFGGTLPAVNGIENAILFKSFAKDGFDDFDEFNNWIINDYKAGDYTNWSNQHRIVSQHRIDNFSDIGNSYEVELNRNGYTYKCCYIIVETSKAYVWIDFTATENTYNENFQKLEDLMYLFEIK